MPVRSGGSRADLQPDLQHHLPRLHPGHQPAAAQLQLARTVQRRAARAVQHAVLLPDLRCQRRLQRHGLLVHLCARCAQTRDILYNFSLPNAIL